MAQVQTPTGYVVELAFPWTTLKEAPAAGAFVGLDIHVNDDDNGGGRDGKLAWFGDLDNAWQTPKAFGNAKLEAAMGTGLTAQYFASTYFAYPLLTRVDAQVDFDWGVQSPAPSVPPNLFTVRWTGSLVAPVTGIYTLAVRSDDGTRLWVNGQLVIDDWFGRATATSTTTVELKAGVPAALRLEYFERWGEAVAALSWVPPGGAIEVIPSRFLFPGETAP